jgi:L-ascorbate metabolism protein UlaG (beta-lactamase superfamily)
MEITHIGHSSFRICGKQTVIVTDPYAEKALGIPYPKTEADIVTVSHEHDDHNAVANVTQKDEMHIFRAPGEYEAYGVKIFGFRTYHDAQQGVERGVNTLFRIEVDGVSIVHCGDLGHQLQSSVVEALGNVDVLLIPTGGVYTIGPSNAAKVIRQLEPSIVIPMHYKVDGMSDSFTELVSFEPFFKEMDKEVSRESKLVVTKDKLPSELQITVLD